MIPKLFLVLTDHDVKTPWEIGVLAVNIENHKLIGLCEVGY